MWEHERDFACSLAIRTVDARFFHCLQVLCTSSAPSCRDTTYGSGSGSGVVAALSLTNAVPLAVVAAVLNCSPAPTCFVCSLVHPTPEVAATGLAESYIATTPHLLTTSVYSISPKPLLITTLFEILTCFADMIVYVAGVNFHKQQLTGYSLSIDSRNRSFSPWEQFWFKVQARALLFCACTTIHVCEH